MKKEVGLKFAFILISLIFLSSGVFAAFRDCRIVEKNECSSLDNNYIVMGLSSETNAHGEIANLDNYDYVLCCGIGGTGDTSCKSYDAENENKIIGLSSTTNAHGETNGLSNYLTNICYEDLACTYGLENCGNGTMTGYDIPLLSLSSETNAHIGGFNDYPIKICCSSSTLSTLDSCEITSAFWDREEAIEGTRVHLNVVGTAGCAGWNIHFNVIGGSNEVTQPINVNFNNDGTATGVWVAEWQPGFLGLGDTDYAFNVSLEEISRISLMSSAPNLTVTQREEDYCATITSCEDYDNEADCNSDASLCEVTEGSTLSEIDCSADNFACNCAWNEETNSCEFAYIEIEDDPIPPCGYGQTLCHNDSGTYCNIGRCNDDEYPTSDGDGICEEGEGCLSEDCIDGDQDTCSDDTYCIDGICSSVIFPLDLGSCLIKQTVEKSCEEEPVGYKVISWTGTWIGEDIITGPYERCIAGGTSTVSCAAQIQLPFFDYFELIITSIVIALIYVSLIFRKKFKK